MRKTLVTILGFVATSIATPSLGNSAPATPPVYTPPPAIAQDGYITFTSRQTFPLPKEVASEWIYTGLKVLAARSQSENFSKPIEVENIKGKWPAVDSVRRTEFSDGHFIFERPIIADPYYFEYQVWGFTNPKRDAVDYTHSHYRLEDGSRGESVFTWTIKAKFKDGQEPTSREGAAPGLQQMMDDTLYQLYSLAASEFGFYDQT